MCPVRRVTRRPDRRQWSADLGRRAQDHRLCGHADQEDVRSGHDTKLKSLLIEAGALGAVVRDDTGAITDVASIARRFGFGSQVASGIAKRLAS